MKCDVIKIEYPGDCISVNHYLGRRKDGGYYVKQETKDWKEKFIWLLNKCHLEDYKLPLEVTCSGYFKNERSAPDLSNLSKVILDSIEELTGVNDKDFRWHDGHRVLMAHRKAESPYLLITIKESGDISKPLPDAPGCKTRRVKASGSGKLSKQKNKGIK